MDLDLRQIESSGPRLHTLLGVLGLLLLGGAWAFWNMEHHGHIVSGMNNQIVWGLPHVFAVFLIVAASGALNVASIASVFGQVEYKPWAPLSALLALALLLGGLCVLLLDLGRPDRLIVAMTQYNFRSVFAWNVFLYTGFMVIVLAYLFTLMNRAGAAWNKPAGFFAFGWRILLTTGTGSIFGFLVAREAFGSAYQAPLFIALSLAYGTAVFVMVLAVASSAAGQVIPEVMLQRLRRLLLIFVVVMLWFVATMYLTGLYTARHQGFAQFVLSGKGVVSSIFWVGQIAFGCLAPIVLLVVPSLRQSLSALVLAAALVVVGGLAQMYVTIVGAQIYPQPLFPGWTESSSFYDGVQHTYTPSLHELLLGLGGVAVAIVIVTMGVRLFRFVPHARPQV